MVDKKIIKDIDIDRLTSAINYAHFSMSLEYNLIKLNGKSTKAINKKMVDHISFILEG